jgi:hypothetical protein
MRYPHSLAAAVALLLTAPVARAQTPELHTLRLNQLMTSRQVTALAAERDRTFAWMTTLCAEIPAARDLGDDELSRTLGEAQYAADSVALLNEQLAEAIPEARQACTELCTALEAELARLRGDAERATGERQLDLEDRARVIEAEIEYSRRALPTPGIPSVTIEPGEGLAVASARADSLCDCADRLRNAAKIVAGERTRFIRRAALHEEMRLLIAEIRLFDEAGIPPSSETGADGLDPTITPGSDCPASCAVAPPIVPGDVPITIDAAVGGAIGVGENQPLPVTAGSLDRLQRELLGHAEALEVRAAELRDAAGRSR